MSNFETYFQIPSSHSVPEKEKSQADHSLTPSECIADLLNWQRNYKVQCRRDKKRRK